MLALLSVDAQNQVDWCLIWQNLEAWEEAKKDIDAIPDHPNKSPSQPLVSNNTRSQDKTHSTGPSGTNRRDSTATVNGR